MTARPLLLFVFACGAVAGAFHAASQQAPQAQRPTLPEPAKQRPSAGDASAEPKRVDSKTWLIRELAHEHALNGAARRNERAKAAAAILNPLSHEEMIRRSPQSAQARLAAQAAIHRPLNMAQRAAQEPDSQRRAQLESVAREFLEMRPVSQP